MPSLSLIEHLGRSSEGKDRKIKLEKQNVTDQSTDRLTDGRTMRGVGTRLKKKDEVHTVLHTLDS